MKLHVSGTADEFQQKGLQLVTVLLDELPADPELVNLRASIEEPQQVDDVELRNLVDELLRIFDDEEIESLIVETVLNAVD